MYACMCVCMYVIHDEGLDAVLLCVRMFVHVEYVVTSYMMDSQVALLFMEMYASMYACM